jgi:hypothetical protein
MRILKLAGALVAMLAFSAVAVATASAAETLWRWLPGSVGETFEGKQTVETGKLTTASKLIILCKAGSLLLVGSELTEKEDAENKKDATLGLATIHFEKCTAAGLAANSLGDASGVILVHIEIHNCVISEKPLEFGLLILPLLIHIEVPSAGLLIEILEKGLFIARIKPDVGDETKHNFLITAKSKVAGVSQDPEKCEGGEKEVLLVKDDAKAEETATLDTEVLIKFDLTKDLNGEEIMV